MTSKGGACKIAMKKFVSIGKFLEKHNEKLYEVLDCLELIGAIHPPNGKSLTFLNPSKKYVDEIIKKAESDDVDDAIEMVQSLILQGDYKNGADFEKFKSDIPTLFGTKLIVKSVKGDTVEIDDGTLTPSKHFKPYTRARKGRTTTLCVWDLDGRVEFKKAPQADYSNLKANYEGRAKKGGNEVGSSAISADLADYSRKNNGKVMRRLNQWASSVESDEKAKEKLTFQYIGTKSPLIDYLLIFCSGLFATLSADAEVKDGAYNELFSSMPEPIDKSNQQFTACIAANKGNNKKIAELYSTYNKDLKDTALDGASLYNLHAFIYYAYNVLKCEQEDSSVDATSMIISCARDCGQLKSGGARMLEPSSFGLSNPVDMTAYYQDFLAKVAFRAPVSSDVISVVEGAGDDSDDDDDEHIYSDFNDVMEESGAFKMSASAMRELRNYVAAHGKCPV